MGRKSPKKSPEAVAFDKGVEAVIYMMDNLGINNDGTNEESVRREVVNPYE